MTREKSPRSAVEQSSSKPFFICGLVLSILVGVMLAAFRAQIRPSGPVKAVSTVLDGHTSAGATATPTALGSAAVTAIPPIKTKDYSVDFDVLKVSHHDPTSFT